MVQERKGWVPQANNGLLTTKGFSINDGITKEYLFNIQYTHFHVKGELRPDFFVENFSSKSKITSTYNDIS